MRVRTGPNWFRVYYKNACFIRFTPKEVGRVFGIAKFTPSVNNIRDWCKEMVAKYEESVSSLKDDQDSTVFIDKEKGFGPECHDVGTDDDNSVSSVPDDESTDLFVPPPMVT
jgi:hypothetical protein